MSVKIFCNKKEILHIKNVTFSFVYESLFQIIADSGYELNPTLDYLMEKLYKGTSGIGFDIADHLKNYYDFITFLALLKSALKKYESDSPYLRSDVKELLWNFYSEIENYGKSLEK